MEEKKKVGRPKGYKPNTIKHKTEKVLGYKYTPTEANLIKEVLELAKKEYKTTSKCLLEIFKFYKENKK